MPDKTAIKSSEQKDIRASISYRVLDLFLKLEDIEKKSRNYGTDTRIYTSEIHIISAIAKHSGIHVAGLADLFGCTSGAISQSINKLEKKGLLYKQAAAENLSKLSLVLTKKGELAHYEHMRYHKVLEQMIHEQLASASAEQLTFLKTFLVGLTDELNYFDEKI